MISKLVLWLAAIAAGAQVSAAPQPQCPVELPASAVNVNAPPGWVQYVPGPLALHSARMASGPPDELAVLMGEPVQGRKRATSYVWTVPGFPQGMWLQCLYGDGGEVVILRRLMESIRACVIEYTSDHGAGRTRVAVSCS